MRSFIRNYIEAEKARREESGEAGFSLIELIVVVVILGILAAVAIPIFLGLQGQAEQSSTDAVAANAASQAASDLAQGTTVTATSFDRLENGGEYTITIDTVPAGGTLSIDNYCVSVDGPGTATATSGPTCP